MADIFVSYATEDRDRIQPLVEILQAQGWSVWWDRDLNAGPSFDDKIEEALDAARCVVVAWSRASINSNWCRVEANEGLERGILVPLRLDDVRPPLAFRGAQTAALIKWPESRGDLDSVLSGIRAYLSRPSTERDPGISTTPPADLGEFSIAVLPFDNLSGDVDREYFSDGVTEALIASLAQLSALKVISRTSVLRFKGHRGSLRDIARELGVRPDGHTGNSKRNRAIRWREDQHNDHTARTCRTLCQRSCLRPLPAWSASCSPADG
jgi:hypothetical protein